MVDKGIVWWFSVVLFVSFPLFHPPTHTRYPHVTFLFLLSLFTLTAEWTWTPASNPSRHASTLPRMTCVSYATRQVHFYTRFSILQPAEWRPLLLFFSAAQRNTCWRIDCCTCSSSSHIVWWYPWAVLWSSETLWSGRRPTRDFIYIHGNTRLRAWQGWAHASDH